MKYLLLILFIIFPFGQLLRLDLGNSIVIHANDAVVGIIGSIGLIKGIKKPILFWGVAVLLSLVFNVLHYQSSQLFVATLYAIRWFAYAGLYFTFKDLSKDNKEIIKKGLVIDVIVIAILGIIQYLFIPDVSFLSTQNWDDHYFRLVSTFLDPGFTGAILALGLIFIFQTSFSKKFSIFLFSVVFTALALTYSRASYLMYFAGFTALAFYKKSLKIFIFAGIILLISVYFLPPSLGQGTNLVRESSTWSRFESWKLGLSLWQKSPIFGVGFDAYRYASGGSIQSHAGAGSDSSLITVMATTGSIGLIAYLVFLKGLCTLGSKSIAFKASLFAVFVHSWFNNTLFYPWVMEWLFLLLVFDS